MSKNDEQKMYRRRFSETGVRGRLSAMWRIREANVTHTHNQLKQISNIHEHDPPPPIISNPLTPTPFTLWSNLSRISNVRASAQTATNPRATARLGGCRRDTSIGAYRGCKRAIEIFEMVWMEQNAAYTSDKSIHVIACSQR